MADSHKITVKANGTVSPSSLEAMKGKAHNIKFEQEDSTVKFKVSGLPTSQFTNTSSGANFVTSFNTTDNNTENSSTDHNYNITIQVTTTSSTLASGATPASSTTTVATTTTGGRITNGSPN